MYLTALIGGGTIALANAVSRRRGPESLAAKYGTARAPAMRTAGSSAMGANDGEEEAGEDEAVEAVEAADDDEEEDAADDAADAVTADEAGTPACACPRHER